MIFKNNKEITQIFKGSLPIVTIYKGTTILWEAIKSCFGNGFWINKKPWLNKEGWKNK